MTANQIPEFVGRENALLGRIVPVEDTEGLDGQEATKN